MNRDALLRELRKAARKRGLEFSVDMVSGKGGHCKVRFGGKITILKSGELSPNYVRLIKRQLEFD